MLLRAAIVSGTSGDTFTKSGPQERQLDYQEYLRQLTTQKRLSCLALMAFHYKNQQHSSSLLPSHPSLLHTFPLLHSVTHLYSIDLFHPSLCNLSRVCFQHKPCCHYTEFIQHQHTKRACDCGRWGGGRGGQCKHMTLRASKGLGLTLLCYMEKYFYSEQTSKWWCKTMSGEHLEGCLSGQQLQFCSVLVAINTFGTCLCESLALVCNANGRMSDLVWQPVSFCSCCQMGVFQLRSSLKLILTDQVVHISWPTKTNSKDGGLLEPGKDRQPALKCCFALYLATQNRLLLC